MRAPAAVAVLTLVAVGCTGSAATTTSTTPLPATSTSTVPVTTTTTSIAYPLYPPDEVAAPGGAWRTTVLTDLSVVGFADLGGEGFMFLNDQDDRVSAYRLSDGGWEAARYAPAKLTNLRRVEWGPMASDGHRVVLTLNARANHVEDGRRPRSVVIASTTDGDVYETSEVADAVFTNIATDGSDWYAIGYRPSLRQAQAVWSSADGLDWDQVDTGELTGDFYPYSIAVGNGRVVIAGRTKGRVGVLSFAPGTPWVQSLLTEYDRGPLAAYVESRFELHTAIGHGFQSTDGVEWVTFADTSAPPYAPEVWGDADRPRVGLGAFITAGNSMHRSDWLYCYDDPDTCRQALAAVWLREDQEWSRVDLPVPGPIQSEDSEGGTLIIGAHLVGGTIAVLGWSYDPTGPHVLGRWVSHWVPDDGTSFPPVSPPLDTSPPLSSYATRPRYDEPPVPGREYAITVGTWCGGLQQLGHFGGQFWVSDDMPVKIQPEWPTKRIEANPQSDAPHGDMVFGVAVLVAEDLIEYRIPGLGVVGTFHPGDRRVFC